MLGDLLGELGDVDAQAIGRIQSRLDVPDVADWEQSAGLHRNRLQHRVREGRQWLAGVLGEHVLDGLQSLGIVCGRDDVALQARFGFILTGRSAWLCSLYCRWWQGGVVVRCGS
ncbi:hypothetical protein D9M68_629380 [compost metagenome]